MNEIKRHANEEKSMYRDSAVYFHVANTPKLTITSQSLHQIRLNLITFAARYGFYESDKTRLPVII